MPSELAPSVGRISEGVFFTTPAALPRGRHTLTRDEIIAAQRERVMIAATELMAAHGFHQVRIGDIGARASVSRAAFYECFADKEACAFAAYDRFIEVLVQRLSAVAEPGRNADDMVTGVIAAYLETMQADLVSARAFQVEMDAVGAGARKKRRDALIGLAGLLRMLHEQDSVRRAGMTAAPGAFVGAVYAVRQLASDALDESIAPDLVGLLPELSQWILRAITND